MSLHKEPGSTRKASRGKSEMECAVAMATFSHYQQGWRLLRKEGRKAKDASMVVGEELLQVTREKNSFSLKLLYGHVYMQT